MNFEQPGNSIEWMVFLAKKYSDMFIEGTWLTLYIAVIGTIIGFCSPNPFVAFFSIVTKELKLMSP